MNGTYGFDTIVIPGPSGPTIPVQHQVIADIVTERFYVGSLGLNAASINFSTSDPNDSAVSLLGSLKSQNSIPSQSFGYTAGAFYKGSGVNGSLTLGGYDASRFVPNDVSFTFAPAKTRQLVASVQSITYSDSKGQQPLMSGGILALVDSTVPYLWLPQSACQAFEKTFGITWDPIANLYLVNETTHSKLVKTNPSVIFEISNSLTGGPAVNITLPYASFDLNASYPLVKTQQRYFPLQIAADENSYTLGRTFFQEAFMIVNFENSTFSLSQAVYDPKTPSHVVAIAPSSDTGTSTNPSSTASLIPVPSSGSSGIGTGAIAGIVIGFILIALISAIAFFCIRRRRKNAHTVAELPGDGPATGKSSPVSDVKGSEPFPDDPPPKNRSTPAVTISEVPMTPPMSPPLSSAGVNEFYRPDSPGSPLKPLELAGDKPPRSELSSPERPSTPEGPTELPSPDPEEIRSELSTPEPVYPSQELPTPDPSHELRTERSLKKRKQEPGTARSSQALPSRTASSHTIPSPGIVSTIIASQTMDPEGIVSPVIGSPADRSASDSETDSHHALSALNSPRLPLQRPTSLRMDSSDSEMNFTREGLPARAFSTQGHYRRQNSSSSDLPTISNFPARRPVPHRNNTDSSDQSNISQLGPSVGPQTQLGRMFPSGSANYIAVRPPHNRGLSQDSDTWETRLEMNSPEEEESPGVERSSGVGQYMAASLGGGHHENGRDDGISLQHRRSTENPNMNGFQTRQVAVQQQNHQQGHRRALSEDEQRVREGLVRAGVLRQSQTEEPEAYASGALQEE